MANPNSITDYPVLKITEPAQFVVLVTETALSGDKHKKLHSFKTEAEFQFYWNDPGYFGGGLNTEKLTYEHLTGEPLAAYLAELLNDIVEIEVKKLEARKIYDRARLLSENLSQIVGFGFMFQDSEGVVYQTNQPEWKSVRFERAEINRTRYPDEAKGSLSIKEAQRAGFEFEVEGK